MITIEEFLYLDNIVETQSRSLITQYPNLTFESPNDFREFFGKQGIRLTKQQIKTQDEKTLLLERFKSFKNSNDYTVVRKYIEEQIILNKKLKDIRQTGGTITSITNLLNGIDESPIDPFFNFVVRKIITGTDDGVLPSEELRVMLDKLIQQNSVEYYDETSDTERDQNDRIVSYKNLYKNRGRIRVPILDQRFTLSDFRYIVDSNFKSLPDAVLAEKNLLDTAKNAGAAILSGTGDTGLDQATIDATTKFLSDLKNLVSTEGNSVTALKSKISSLEELLSVKDDIIQDQIDAEVRISESLTALSIENANNIETIQTLESTNKLLQEQISGKLSSIEQDVAKQLEEIPNQFDKLSSELEKQSDALQKTLQDLADSNKTTNTTESAASEILPLLDDIYAVVLTSGVVLKTTINPNYDKIKELFQIIGYNEPALPLYAYRILDRDDRSVPAGKRMKQVLYWNRTIKPQLKAEISKIVETDKLERIKKLLMEIIDINSSSNLTLYNVIDASVWQWFKDQGGSQGVGRSIIRDVYLTLNPKGIPPSTDGGLYDSIVIDSSNKLGLIPNGVRKSDAELSLDLLDLLDGISSKVNPNNGWL
jgi:hypothetical protein